MKIKKRTMLVILFVVIGMMAFNLGKSTNNNSVPKQIDTNSPHASYSTTLNYGVSMEENQYCNPGDYVSWSFSSSNNVGITVMAIDSSNYYPFLDSQSYSSITLSDGSYSSDSGTFYPSYSDTWYIVYYNDDPVDEQTTVTETTTFYAGTSSNSISITNPDLSSNWNAGSSYEIDWTYSGSFDWVNINLYQDGVYYSTIATDAYNDGYYDWTLPTDLSSGDYQIEIEDASDTSTYDISSDFYITATVSDSISITNPDSSSDWTDGSSYEIDWTSTGNINDVDIYLYQDGSYYSTIDTDVYNNGFYDWTVPSDLSAGNYQIEIQDSSNGATYDYSGSFYVASGSSSSNNQGNNPGYNPGNNPGFNSGLLILLLSITLIAVNVIIMIWLYKDAQKRNMNGVLWIFLSLVLGVIALIIYLIIRNNQNETTYYDTNMKNTSPFESDSPSSFKPVYSNNNNIPKSQYAGSFGFENQQNDNNYNDNNNSFRPVYSNNNNIPKSQYGGSFGFENQQNNYYNDQTKPKSSSNFSTNRKKICLICGAVVEAKAKYCPNCGSTV